MFDVQIQMNIRFVYKKIKNKYFKAKNSFHTIRISSFEYVFIVFFETNYMIKYILLYLFHFQKIKRANLLSLDQSSFPIFMHLDLCN